MKKSKPPCLTTREALILQMREEDKRTFKEIAAVIRCGHQYARTLYLYALSAREYCEVGYKSNPYCGLSSRVSNCLANGNLKKREDILLAYETGQLRKFRNLGIKGLRELAEWLGLPPPPIRSKPVKLDLVRECIPYLPTELKRKVKIVFFGDYGN